MAVVATGSAAGVALYAVGGEVFGEHTLATPGSGRSSSSSPRQRPARRSHRPCRWAERRRRLGPGPRSHRCLRRRSDDRRPRRLAASMARLSMVGIVCLSLFASLFARLWYLQVIDKSEHVRRGADPQAHRPGRGHPGSHPRRQRQGPGRQPAHPGHRASTASRCKDKTPEGRARRCSTRWPSTLTRSASRPRSPAISEQYNDSRYGPLDLVPIVTTSRTATSRCTWPSTTTSSPAVVVRRKAVRTYPYGKVRGAPPRLRAPDQRQGARRRPRRQDRARDGDVEGVRAEAVPGRRRDREGRRRADVRGRPAGHPGRPRRSRSTRAGDNVTTSSERSPRPGDDVWLTIDIDVQAYAERRLAEKLDARSRARQRQGRQVRERAAGLGGHRRPARTARSSPWRRTRLRPDRPRQRHRSASVDSQLNDKASRPAVVQLGDAGHVRARLDLQAVHRAPPALTPGSSVPATRASTTAASTRLEAARATSARSGTPGGAHGGVDLAPKALTVSSDVYFYWIGDQLLASTGRRSASTAIQDAAAALRPRSDDRHRPARREPRPAAHPERVARHATRRTPRRSSTATGSPATTSTLRSARATCWSRRCSWRTPTPPSPTAAPGTPAGRVEGDPAEGHRRCRPVIPPTTAWCARSKPRSPARSTCRRGRRADLRRALGRDRARACGTAYDAYPRTSRPCRWPARQVPPR